MSRSSPEESVRQRLLIDLCEKMGYPSGWIMRETGLDKVPKAKTSVSAPRRRVDILCLAKGQDGRLQPLLLIECKAHKTGESDCAQVVGYNECVGAPFLAVVGPEDRRWAYFDIERAAFVFEEGLPSFKELIALLEPSQLAR